MTPDGMRPSWHDIQQGPLWASINDFSAATETDRAIPAGSGACFWLLVAGAGVAAFAVGWIIGVALK